jgi:AbrB family looped-hinge helix DNA binding protein
MLSATGRSGPQSTHGGAFIVNTGIVRKIDDLGRVVIPAEMRRLLGIREGDALEIVMDGDHIAIRPRIPTVVKHIKVDSTKTVEVNGEAVTLEPGEYTLERIERKR